MTFLELSRAKFRITMPLIIQKGQRIKKFLTISAMILTLGIYAGGSSAAQSNRVYALLYNPNTDNEWIHSIQMDGNNTILMFDSSLDAQNFVGQLKKQNFPSPAVEEMEITEILSFCRTQKYICQLIPTGIVVNPPPKNNPDVKSKLPGLE